MVVEPVIVETDTEELELRQFVDVFEEELMIDLPAATLVMVQTYVVQVFSVQ